MANGGRYDRESEAGAGSPSRGKGPGSSEQSGPKGAEPEPKSGDFSQGSQSSHGMLGEGELSSAIEVEPELDPLDAPSEAESSPPSIPPAAGVGADDAASSPGAVAAGVLPGHVIASRYEVLGV